jgi:putative ABC transport system permease protein
MLWVAFRMLAGNTSRYLGMIAGIAISTLLIAQQCSMFCGMMLQTASSIRDVHDAQLWVMVPDVHFADEVLFFQEKLLDRVRGTRGVEWAVPNYRYYAQIRCRDGGSHNIGLVGLDDATFIGGPQRMLKGSVTDLRRPQAIIIDQRGYSRLWPGEPLRVGREVEIDEHRAIVVGVCRTSPTYQTIPIVYTAFSFAKSLHLVAWVPLTYVFAKVKPGHAVEDVRTRLVDRTGLRAMTRTEFTRVTVRWFLSSTGIMLNFVVTVALGLIVGIAISGTMFYVFTIESLAQYGTLKAFGVTNAQLRVMVLAQGLIIGCIGYGVGMGLAALVGEILYRAELNLTCYMPWEVVAGTACAEFFVVAIASCVSISRVVRLETGVAMRK